MSTVTDNSSKKMRGGFFPTLKRELGLIGHRPYCILFMFVLPISTFGVLWAAFYEPIPTDLPIVVVDNDNSTLSRTLLRMFDATQLLEVKATVQDMQEGSHYIRAGKAYALIYFPRNMERDVKRAQSPEVSMFFNNQWVLSSGLISKTVRSTVVTVSAGLDIRSRMLQGQNPATAYAQFSPINIESHPLFNPQLDYRAFLLPPLLITVLQAFIILVTVYAIGTELKFGTAKTWLQTAGGHPIVALTAKLLPYTISFSLLSIFVIALLYRYVEIPFRGNLGYMLCAAVLYVLAYQAMGFFFIIQTANFRLASSLACFYAGPAFAFAGITYPCVGMPVAAKCWSLMLPLTHYSNILFQQGLRGAPPHASYNNYFALVLFIVIPLMLTMLKFGKVLREPKYWGKT